MWKWKSSICSVCNELPIVLNRIVIHLIGLYAFGNSSRRYSVKSENIQNNKNQFQIQMILYHLRARMVMELNLNWMDLTQETDTTVLINSLAACGASNQITHNSQTMRKAWMTSAIVVALHACHNQIFLSWAWFFFIRKLHEQESHAY